MAYKGMMLNGVPNCAFTVGYTNASWTLKADLTSEYVCRMLAHMDAHGYRKSVPEISDPTVTEKPLLDFTSGYVLRSLHEFPKQGSKEPWKLRQNYVLRHPHHPPRPDRRRRDAVLRVADGIAPRAGPRLNPLPTFTPLGCGQCRKR